jgi:hypothetical protein
MRATTSLRARVDEGSAVFVEGYDVPLALLQQDAAGLGVTTPLLLVHAENQLMQAETFCILAMSSSTSTRGSRSSPQAALRDGPTLFSPRARFLHLSAQSFPPLFQLTRVGYTIEMQPRAALGGGQ